MLTLDVTSGDLLQIASLQGNPIIAIDAWVEPPGAVNPLRAVSIEQEFFVRTPTGDHNGKPQDYLVENIQRKRWVVPRSVFRALFGASL